jgi:hypothetical protein
MLFLWTIIIIDYIFRIAGINQLIAESSTGLAGWRMRAFMQVYRATKIIQ